MKNKRINLVVIFLMVITLIMATAISASAATVKINKKTVTIDAGSSVTLKIMAYAPDTYQSAGAIALNTDLKAE